MQCRPGGCIFGCRWVHGVAPETMRPLVTGTWGLIVSGAITTDFNAVMNEVNSELYPHGERKVCPKFRFKVTAKGISYEFDHCGDRGSGAKSRHVAIFDVAMLRHTPLPFLIHDSAIIKLVGYAPSGNCSASTCSPQTLPAEPVNRSRSSSPSTQQKHTASAPKNSSKQHESSI